MLNFLRPPVLIVALLAMLSADAFAQNSKPTAKPANPAMAPVQDDPALPRVLLIGDSISIGYTLPVREKLKGAANVHRPPANCGPTTRGLDNIDKWLGDSKWDVIHFNFGLHDLKYVDEAGKNADPSKGKHQVPVEQYEANLRKLVARLKQTGAKLIWASTTPVPADSPARIEKEELAYNEAAARVMKENGIPTDDLHAVVVANPAGQRPKDVHYTPEGYDRLGDAVAASIKARLAQ